MKYFILILLALLCSCGQYFPYSTNREINESVVIIVECRNDKSVESAVVQVLKLVRINDFEKKEEGSVLFIKARYKDLPDYKATQIKDDLRMSGVFDIQIIKDGLPVKNIF